MMESSQSGQEHVDAFILQCIDTVPHMEALLLLWDTRPRPWSEDHLAGRLFVSADTVRRIMRDLARHGLIDAWQTSDPIYGYRSQSLERDRLIEAVAAAYRQDLVRVSTMIHTKAPGFLREFVRVFKFGRKK